MNTSSRFVVATHILTALAGRRMFVGEGFPINSDEIADSVNTNPVVIRRILGKLREAGFVETKSGPNGGTVLIKDPQTIKLSEIYSTVEEEGSLFHMHYCTPNSECPVGSHIQESLKDLLHESEAAFLNVLNNRTLYDIGQDIIARSKILERFTREEIKEQMLSSNELFSSSQIERISK